MFTMKPWMKYVLLFSLVVNLVFVVDFVLEKSAARFHKYYLRESLGLLGMPKESYSFITRQVIKRDPSFSGELMNVRMMRRELVGILLDDSFNKNAAEASFKNMRELFQVTQAKIHNAFLEHLETLGTSQRRYATYKFYRQEVEFFEKECGEEHFGENYKKTCKGLFSINASK